jgi:hypothetical protein
MASNCQSAAFPGPKLPDFGLSLGEAKFKSTEKWTWYTPVRTALEKPFNFRVHFDKTYLYQELSSEAQELRSQGLSWVKIAGYLKVTDKTARKAASKGSVNSSRS